MKKFLKKAEGFTLVELIVVIAILGILAGVAVPAYTGYIKKANDATVVTELSAIKTAADAKAAEGQTTVSGITVDETGTVAVTMADTSKNIAAAANALDPYFTFSTDFATKCSKSASYTKGAVWSTANAWQPGT